MTDERTLDQELAERKRLILRLQEYLAYAVRALLGGGRATPI